ncbi:MAG: hypothetical protein K5851_03010 [Lachnospiraceae bacterium]|nr:hypothetical protein [Lachnospiraceae bacterium]
MSIAHLNCTTEELRERICEEYIVHADDCIVLFNNRTVRSDANNRIIRDKFYQFSCEHKITKEKRIITCGSGAARHLCSIIGEPMPRSMNPFEGNDENFEHDNDHNAIANRNLNKTWNPIRKQLYNAIQLFIIYYQESLTPGTQIFKILQSVANKKYIHLKPNEYQYLGFMSIVTKFKTDIPTILENLAKYNTLREFHFEQIANEIGTLYPNKNNVFRH